MRHSNRIGVDWQTHTGNDFTWEQVSVEVLMDIRDELRRLNRLLHCPNFVAIPAKLDALRRKTPAKKKRA